jgi:hypothetical protein
MSWRYMSWGDLCGAIHGAIKASGSAAFKASDSSSVNDVDY